jgi:UDP-N-acetylglucosamine enolpyruvyl transferase
MTVLMTLAPGISIITERVFEARFTHAAELAREESLLPLRAG